MPPYNINIPSQVKQYANIGAFPATGNNKTIYISQDTNFWYRWDGATYVPVIASASVGFGDLTGSPSDNSALASALNAKEPTITAGTTTKYWRGDKTFQTLDTGSVPENGNLYFTNARAQAAAPAETAATIGSIVNGATNYPTPLDADKIGIWDTANSLFKSLTWANLKATLATWLASVSVSFTNKSGNISQWTNDSKYLQCISKVITDSSSSTGTSGAPVYMRGLLIPANSVQVGDILEWVMMSNKTGNTGTSSDRAYIHTLDQLSGATALGQVSTNTTTDTCVFGRMMLVRSPTQTVLPDPATAQQARDGLNSGLVATLNIDWTVDQYLISAIQPSSTSDTIKNQMIYIWRHP